MKRFWVVILLVMMVFNSTFSLAETTVSDREATFLGLQFGVATPEDGMKALVEAGYLPGGIEEEADVYLFTPVDTTFEDKDKRFVFNGADKSGIELSSSEDHAVAGHTAIDTTLSFIYGFEDGVVVKDRPTLFEARYLFYPEETKQLFDDLLEKLNKVYGKSEVYTDKYKFSDEPYYWIEELAFWGMANDTGIFLQTRWYSEDGIIPVVTDYVSLLEIVYGRTNTYDQLQQISDFYNQQEFEAEQKRIEENKDNTEGL